MACTKETALLCNEKDWLVIIEALELLQKDAVEQLRDNDFEELEEYDRDYKERFPAIVASVLRKVDKAYNAHH